MIVALGYISYIVVGFAFGILRFIALWKLFEKANEPGIYSIIPVFSYMKYTKIATGSYLLSYVYLAVSFLIFADLIILVNDMVDISPEYDSYINIALVLALVGLFVPLLIIYGYTNYMFGKSYGMPKAWNIGLVIFGQLPVILMGFDNRTTYVGARGIPNNRT